jgi:hypothetical protein
MRPERDRTPTIRTTLLEHQRAGRPRPSLPSQEGIQRRVISGPVAEAHRIHPRGGECARHGRRPFLSPERLLEEPFLRAPRERQRIRSTKSSMRPTWTRTSESRRRPDRSAKEGTGPLLHMQRMAATAGTASDPAKVVRNVPREAANRSSKEAGAEFRAANAGDAATRAGGASWQLQRSYGLRRTAYGLLVSAPLTQPLVSGRFTP